MFRLPRPNSTIFRLTLALALLAWTALAFGAPERAEANHAPAIQAQVQSVSSDCHDTMAAAPGSRDASMPMSQTGHGDCCQAACQCLAASTAVMNVPWVFVVFVPPGEPVSAASVTPVPPALAAPPLRPPIA